MDKTHHREGTSVTPMRHTSLGTNAQMMVMMQSFRSSAEKKVEEKWSCGLLRTIILEGGQD